VFRRIKYATNPGRFESMKKWAIWLYLGDMEEEDTQMMDVLPYKVTFFYTDPHGDKVSIESDKDIFSAANQFTKGGLKVFANVQSRRDEDEDMTEERILAGLIKEGISRYFEHANKTEDNKRQQHQAEFIRRYVEHANKAEEDAKQAEDMKQADLIAKAATRRCSEDAEKKQAVAASETFEESESTDETTSEEAQAGNSDEEESDEGRPVRPHWRPLPNEVDIMSKGDAEPSFASDAEGSGEIAAVLGETLDRVAQAIDEMHSEFDRTPLAQEIDQLIVGGDAKEVRDEICCEELVYNMSESGEDGKDDCSHDSWNVVSDHSDDTESRA
jgi:hypothetical protein